MFWLTLNLSLILLTGLSGFAIYVYWKKHTHSREHFAFALSNIALFLSVFVLTAVWTQQKKYYG